MVDMTIGAFEMLNDEHICTFAQATRVLPEVNGRRPHPSTIWRWARKGVFGIKLETRRIGGRFVTSREALERFARRLAEVDAAERPEPTDQRSKARSDKQRESDVRRAERELRKAGI